MRSDVASYYPLAVGNKWIYSCSVEGEHAFDKTLTIVGRQTTNRLTYFRGELVVGDDPNPLVLYFIVDGQGNVYSSLDKSSEAKELIITAKPKKGDTLGSLSVAANEEIDTPAAGTITAIRLENFALDDPKVSELKRMDWEGKFYARGVGLVAEADGLGGECILIDFSLNSGK